MQDYEILFYVLDLAGVAVFAVSGALSAGRKSLDLLGVLVIAIVTAIGGGTLRDLLLDRHPLFWFTDLNYLLVIALAAGVTMIYVRLRPPPRYSLLIADALGLAVFTVGGAQIAAEQELPGAIVILLGTITGVAGGMLRDVLSAEVPLILRRDLYATAAISGAAAWLGMRAAGTGELPAALAGMGVVVGLRMGAILLGWRLPVFQLARRPD